MSGGSILAAHLSTRWEKATQSPEDFVQVAAELLQFTQTDIRNSAIKWWLWTHIPILAVVVAILQYFGAPLLVVLIALVVSALVIWICPPRRAFFLERKYKQHFGSNTLEQIPLPPSNPLFAIAATDTKQHQRVAFTPTYVYRFNFNGALNGEPAPSGGVELALAVTASSAFPPVFDTLRLPHRRLGIRYDELPHPLYLSDGGVSGNLGIEILDCLIEHALVSVKELLICDAECGRVEEPSANAFGVLDAQSSALSEHARQLLTKYGNRASLLRVVQRPGGSLGFPIKVTTLLSGFRTDLDKPSWQECYALIVHGAAVCALHRNPDAHSDDTANVRH